jgi:hypothetical protein
MTGCDHAVKNGSVLHFSDLCETDIQFHTNVKLNVDWNPSGGIQLAAFFGSG